MANARRLAPDETPDFESMRIPLQHARNDLASDKEFYEFPGWKRFEEYLDRSYALDQTRLEIEGTSPARSEFLRGRIDITKTLRNLSVVNEAKFNQNSARFEELRLQEEEIANG